MGAVKRYVEASGGAQEKRKDRMKLSLPSKLVEKTSLSLNYFVFVKFSIPVTCLMPCYAETSCSCRPNCVTLKMTLLYKN